MERKFLDIDNCIIIHDVKQIKKEPPKPKIKTKNKLSKILHARGFEGTKVSIYTKLSRYEKEGFNVEDKELTEAILSVLEVNKEELIKEL